MKNLIAYVMVLFSLFFMGAWVVSAQSNTISQTESPTATPSEMVENDNDTPSGAPQTGFGTMSR